MSIMLINVNGWGKDHGEKNLFEADLTNVPLKGGPWMPKEPSLEIRRSMNGSGSSPPEAVISSMESMRLNGDYAMRIILTRDEIARLFYLTHNDVDFRTVVGRFLEFKKQEDEAAEAEAEAEAKRQAEKRAKGIRRI
jgi:hypothetical protein